MQQGFHCPGPQLSSGLMSDHDHSLPPGRTAPSGCSCFQQESDDSPALTFPDWSGDTNSHSQGWKSVRKFSRWKPVQPKGNHIMLYNDIGNFIKNKMSKQKEQQWKEKLLAILPPEEMLSKCWPQHEAFPKTSPCFTLGMNHHSMLYRGRKAFNLLQSWLPSTSSEQCVRKAALRRRK